MISLKSTAGLPTTVMTSDNNVLQSGTHGF